MPTITTPDGVEIFYKDWGSGQPIVFSHGWPLSADDWDNQMLFFLQQGYRVIAHDRRGHGRSTQTADGHDMDHYADDLAALTAHLDLKNAIHVGHSTGGGEVVHYLGRHGESRVSKAAIISAVPPLMLKTTANPLGLPKSAFDDLQSQLAANRSKFYRDIASGPFYGFNRPGVQSIEATIQNWANTYLTHHGFYDILWTWKPRKHWPMRSNTSAIPTILCAISRRSVGPMGLSAPIAPRRSRCSLNRVAFGSAALRIAANSFR
jgi:pimeloyl-ACP methyl ester carboxylesterase